MDELIFDIGMHRGEDAEFYLLKGFRVVGVEADPELAAYCKSKLTRFIDCGQLDIIPRAIVDSERMVLPSSTVTFYRASVSVCGTLSAEREAHYKREGVRTEAIQVPTISFQELLERYGVPYYAKIDIEGGDICCLETLLRCGVRPQFLSVEAEKYDLGEQKQQLDLLSNIGYKKFQLTQQLGGFRNQHVESPPREGRFVEWQFPSASSGLFGKELPGVEWVDAVDIERRLRIFARQERRWGIDGIQRNWFGKKLHGVLKRMLRDPLPGWYDIHATA